ncbi:hypothetical protein BS47DRAFT_1345360, partial [Hydnum rufescens UP504]
MMTHQMKTRSDAKPYEPHTHYHGCVGLGYHLNHPPNESLPPLGNHNTPGKQEPQTRPAQEHPPDKTREWEHTMQDCRDPRRATHPPKWVC